MQRHFDYFEHGITLDVSGPAPQLLTAPPDSGQDKASLISAIRSNKRLLATTTLPVYSGFTMTILNAEGQPCNYRITNLSMVNGPHLVREYIELSDVSYCLRCAFYHLDSLISLYSVAACNFAQILPADTVLKGTSSDERIFFEAEACITSAIRTLDALGKAVWKFYGSGLCPDKLEFVLRHPKITNQGLDLTVTQELLDWLDTNGLELRHYRNRLMHSAPLHRGYCAYLCLPIYRGTVGVFIQLPDDATQKDRHKYTFVTGPEMLAYCHERCCDVLSIVERVVDFPRIRSARLFPTQPSNPPVTAS